MTKPKAIPLLAETNKDQPAQADGPMTAEAAPPTYAKIGVTSGDICQRIRVIDDETGDLIEKVIEADVDKGFVVRYLVEDGALVLDNNRFKTVEEERKIRIEWRTGNQKDSF